MERTEPTLVPQWLRNSSSSNGITSPSHSDDPSSPSVSRNNSSVIGNGHTFGRPSGADKTSNSYTRWNSNGTSSGRVSAYNSSGRNQRDKLWEKGTNGYHDQDKTFSGSRWHREPPEQEGNAMFSRLGREGSWRSQATAPDKRVDSWTRKGATDSSAGVGKNNDSLVSKSSLPSGGTKAVFERDFPSLRVVERAFNPDIGRVPSPGLSPAIQNLLISPTSRGEKWTSALAEVPVMVSSNVVSSSSTPVGLSASTGLNMAEAVTHGPLRATTPPQLSTEAQRREELAIKQSRQLIPVTPSIPKALALNSSDKQRSKVGQAQPQLSAQVNHSARILSGKGDSSKTANPVKFHVLKPARDKNGVTSSVKDSLSQTSNKKVGSSVDAPHVSVTGNDINHVDHKPVQTVPEKRPVLQAQSRSEFFKLVRKKSMENPCAANSDASNSTPDMENIGDAESPSEIEIVPHSNDTAAVDAPNSVINCQQVATSPKQKPLRTCNEAAFTEQKFITNGGTHHSLTVSDDEEAALLRSMGWEENDEEDGITEEEISDFRLNLSKYIESNPPLRILQGTELKFLLPYDSSQNGNGITSDAKLQS